MKNLNLTNTILIGGVLLLGYYLYKRKPKVIDVKPDILEKKEPPKTIVLNLNQPQGKQNSFYDDVYVRDYDASKFSTIAPPMVVVKRNV